MEEQDELTVEQNTEPIAPAAETESSIPSHELEKPDHVGSPEPEPAGEVPQPTGIVIEVGGQHGEEDNKPKDHEGDDLAGDFFEKGEEKPKYVEEISGMTAVTEDEGEESEEGEEKLEVSEIKHFEETTGYELLIKEDIEQFAEKEETTMPEGKSPDDKIVVPISKHQGRQLTDTKRMMPKKSMKSRSIAYELLPRITSEQDFATMFDLELDEDTQIELYDYDDLEEEEEQEAVVEEKAPPLDRKPYYEKHEIITKEIAERKVKNYILQKKLAIFFKKRKMEHVLKDTGEQQFETVQNYGRKLDTYGELLELDKRERTRINIEIESNRTQREEKFAELQKLFETMQNKEKDVGTGLINTKTGNAIPDKLVERFIRRQNNTMDQVCSMRLNFIKLKGMVQEKLNAIAAIDRIGENLYLIDYEQLKMENRSHADKIEEREEELTRLREKCQNTIQVLAHIREKSAALETDVEDLNDELYTVESNSNQIRETLNYLKQRRDHFRHMINKLKEDSGLLTQPTLLEDMEKSMSDVKYLSEELDNLLEEHKSKTKQIRNIRKQIEIQSEGYIRKEPIHKIRSKTKMSAEKPQIYMGRPCLYMPTMPKNAFDHLKDIKPRPFNLPKKRR